MLKVIYQPSEYCCELGVKLFRFRVSARSPQINLNHVASMNLVLLEQTPILDIFGTYSSFRNDTFLSGMKVQDVWNAFVECWATIYT